MSFQSFLLFSTFVSCAIFVLFVLGLKGENDRLQELLKTSLAHHQDTIVEIARLKYEALGRSIQLSEEVKGNERRNAKLTRIKVEIWGTEEIDRNIDDAINWICEARDVANYHAEYSVRLREHYAELEEKYNAMAVKHDWLGSPSHLRKIEEAKQPSTVIEAAFSA